MEKRCVKCKKIKDTIYFSKNNFTKDGFQAWCKECTKKRYDEWVKQNQDRNRFLGKRWREAHPENFIEWKQENKERFHEWYRKHKADFPEKWQARLALSRAIKNGTLKPAKTLKCVRCGKQAKHWHHHKGYDKKHWLDVIPVCVPCHGILDGK